MADDTSPRPSWPAYATACVLAALGVGTGIGIALTRFLQGRRSEKALSGPTAMLNPLPPPPSWDEILSPNIVDTETGKPHDVEEIKAKMK